jgi:hypothetical protein
VISDVSNGYVHSRIAKIERLGTPLVAVSDQGDGLILQITQVGVVIVVDLGH